MARPGRGSSTARTGSSVSNCLITSCVPSVLPLSTISSSQVQPTGCSRSSDRNILDRAAALLRVQTATVISIGHS